MIGAGDREMVAAICADRAGLRVDPDKAYLIESRLAPVARREGFDALEDFLDAVRHRREERLIWAMVEAMIPPDTSFFRDPAVFEVLARDVLPDLARRTQGPVRVWSAACGAGQEVYSLAMLLDETPGLTGRVELFASDLSERSLEKARAGLYSQFEVQRGLPARKLVRHFEREGDSFRLSPRIRQMVRWRRVNLLDDLSSLGCFELVMCRNVLSSLTGEGRERVLEGLTRAVTPGGRLVLGLHDAGEAWLDPVAAEAGVFSTEVPRAA